MATRSTRSTDTPSAPASPAQLTEDIGRSSATSPDSYQHVAEAVRAPATGDGADGPAPSWEPGQVAAGIGAAGSITHLWSYDAADGVWIFVNGLGWKRLSPASAHGHSHMTILSSIATHANIPIDYHVNASDQIDQMYV